MEGQRQAGENGQSHQPEPKEDVDFLVEDVEREDTEAVMGLDSSRDTILVEDALGNLVRHSRVYFTAHM